MPPLMPNFDPGRLGEAAPPLKPRIESEIANHLGYVEASLAGRDWLLGSEITAADVQMSFVGEIVKSTGRGADYPNIVGWVDRFQARPAYKTALAKGGPYNMGPK